MRLTFVELLIVVFLLGWVALAWWLVYRLFHQTTELGAIKWGVVILALAIGSAGTSSSRRRG